MKPALYKRKFVYENEIRFRCCKRIKKDESRVSLTPDSVKFLTEHNHTIYVETNAGLLSGFSDEMYIEAGAKIVQTKEELWDVANVIVKVKEPQKKNILYLKKTK